MGYVACLLDNHAQVTASDRPRVHIPDTPGGVDTVDAVRPLAYDLVLDSGWIE